MSGMSLKLVLVWLCFVVVWFGLVLGSAIGNPDSNPMDKETSNASAGLSHLRANENQAKWPLNYQSNPIKPDTRLVNWLQEIHMIKKYDDHEWVYDPKLSKWDLYLEGDTIPRPTKYPMYLILYTTEEITAYRCQEYFEQLNKLNKVKCSIPVHIALLWKWRGQGVFKLILILLRTFDTPRLEIMLAGSLFNPNSIQTEKDPTELKYLLKDIPEEMKKRVTIFSAKEKHEDMKWHSFFEMIKRIYIQSNTTLDEPNSTQPNPT
ncbi:hypothetical protein NEHOM01_0434 [Nematocida homosporus]|uniref:uncharacterized protein n=1 Tax=Nematocida homosporus TaxID=1912981 RepID=UPI00221E87BF|nr:uncharacterized protein NEHOM01_0434 [Nematocida homosporus]KAI5184832.1 hypothetical protein NEHOM01_0434 [Nematocida homosporus]